jgi:hypothetical protein
VKRLTLNPGLLLRGGDALPTERADDTTVHLSQFVPEGEATHVESNSLLADADPLHHNLLLRDRLLAGVARLTVTGPAPDSRDAVSWKATVVELALNETTEERQLFHGAPGEFGEGQHQATFTGVSTPESVNP